MKKKKQKLTINTESTVSIESVKDGKQMQNIRFELNTSLIRNETMEGKQWKVIPMVMMVEGVLSGSSGPLFYSKEEMGKNLHVWNHKPVVVYHPQLNGEAVSACLPEVLTASKIGVILNTTVEDLKMKAEAWIDEERANEVDPRIMEAVHNNTMMELSTGVYVNEISLENEESYNGKSYQTIATNLLGDHLAVLPDQIGACSIKDGAGFIRNQSFSKTEFSDDEVYKDAENKINSILEPYITNELSNNTVTARLRVLLKEQYASHADSEGYVSVWVEDVFDTYFIYEFQGNLWKLGFSKKDDIVTIEDITMALEVVRTVSYVPSKQITSNSENTNNKVIMKEKLVNDLIANHGWAESDRELLLSKDEEFLSKLTPSQEEKPTPTENQEAQPKTVEQYIAAAPEGFRDVLTASLQTHQSAKSKLIETIVANKNNSFSKEFLANKGIAELQGLAALAGPTKNKEEGNVPMFIGQSEVMNHLAEHEEEALTLNSVFGETN